MPYPAKKTPKLIEEVLSRIALGETLASLGRELDFHPQSWADWMRADEGLAIAYQRARDVGADALAEQALALIDSTPERVDGKIDPGFVQWKRAQVETRLKLLAKWNPKKYGDKQSHEFANKDGESLKVEHKTEVDEVALTLALSKAIRNQKDAE